MTDNICLGLTSLSMIISRSIHVAVGIAAFIFRAEYSSNVYMHHILIQSSAIVNSASVNTGVQYLFELWFSLDICSGAVLLDLMVALFLVF